jgi:hypothetical protein
MATSPRNVETTKSDIVFGAFKEHGSGLTCSITPTRDVQMESVIWDLRVNSSFVAFVRWRVLVRERETASTWLCFAFYWKPLTARETIA